VAAAGAGTWASVESCSVTLPPAIGARRTLPAVSSEGRMGRDGYLREPRWARVHDALPGYRPQGAVTRGLHRSAPDVGLSRARGCQNDQHLQDAEGDDHQHHRTRDSFDRRLAGRPPHRDRACTRIDPPHTGASTETSYSSPTGRTRAPSRSDGESAATPSAPDAPIAPARSATRAAPRASTQEDPSKLRCTPTAPTTTNTGRMPTSSTLAWPASSLHRMAPI